MSDFYNSRVPKARKVYQCEGCKMAIEIGEVYRRETGVYDGDFYTVSSHIECHELDIEMREDADCGCDEWFGMWEELGQGDYPDDNPFRVRFNAICANKRPYKEAKDQTK